MNNFAWIIDGSSFPYVKGDGGVSDSYILPSLTGGENAPKLAGSNVLMIIRTGGKDAVFARLHIAKVEQFEEGYNKNDFLLTVDRSRSYRAFSNTQAMVAPSTSTQGLGLGLSPLSDTDIISIETPLQHNIATNFRKPADAILDRIPKPLSQGSIEKRASRAISDVVGSLALDEMWATTTPKRLPPIAHFAYLKIEREYGREAANELADTLAGLDPIVKSASETTKAAGADKKSYSRAPVVDTSLTPIDVDRLYARRFVAKEKTIDLADIVEKIEHAEKAHQDMLRDVAAYLKKIGRVPLQSSSIDLLIEGKKGDYLFELKSANVSNILNQSAKGAFQLYCYRNALLEDGRSVAHLGLILHKTDAVELDAYAKTVLSQMGITAHYYDPSLEWPERIIDFVNVFELP